MRFPAILTALSTPPWHGSACHVITWGLQNIRPVGIKVSWEGSSWPQYNMKGCNFYPHFTSLLCLSHVLILWCLWPVSLGQGLSAPGITDSGSLGKDDRVLPGSPVCCSLSLVSVVWASEIWLLRSKDKNFLIQLLHVCCLLPAFVP